MTSPYDDVDPERQYRLDHLNKIMWPLAYSISDADAVAGDLEQMVEVHLGNSVTAEEVLQIGEWAGVMEDFASGQVDGPDAVRSLTEKGVINGYAVLAVQTIADRRGIEGVGEVESDDDDDVDFSDFEATGIEQAILREGETPRRGLSHPRIYPMRGSRAGCSQGSRQEHPDVLDTRRRRRNETGGVARVYP